MTNMSPFDLEDVILLEEILISHKANYVTMIHRFSNMAGIDSQKELDSYNNKLNKLELLLLKVKSFKNK